eukprot:c38788_g1_i1.p1 GENE.c38788_g1_i1~~c38788_g1_i1.p1  ORF type:complete len:383 (-),score=79.31 c38788_g1_i1:17-1165(-)
MGTPTESMRIVLLLGVLLGCHAEHAGYIPCSCSSHGAVLVQLAEDDSTSGALLSTAQQATDDAVGISVEHPDYPESDSVCVCKRMKKPVIPVRCTKKGLLHGNCNDRDEMRAKGLEIAPEPLVTTLYPDEVPRAASGKVFHDDEVEKTEVKNLAVEDQSVVGKAHLQKAFKKQVLLMTKDLVVNTPEAPAATKPEVSAPLVAPTEPSVVAPQVPEVVVSAEVAPVKSHTNVPISAKPVSLEELAKREEKRKARAQPKQEVRVVATTEQHVEANENAGFVTVDVPPELKGAEAPETKAAEVAVPEPVPEASQPAVVADHPTSESEPAPVASLASTPASVVEDLGKRLESQTQETDQLKQHVAELEAELKAIVAAAKINALTPK